MSDYFEPAVYRADRATHAGDGLKAPLRDRTDLTRITLLDICVGARLPKRKRETSPARTRPGLSSRVSWANRAEFASFVARWGLRSWALITSSARRRTHRTLPAPAPVGRGVLGDMELVPPAGGGVGAARNGSVLSRARRVEASASRPVTWRTGTMASRSSSTVAATTPHRFAPEMRGRRRQGVPLPVCDRPQGRRPPHRAARSRPHTWRTGPPWSCRPRGPPRPDREVAQTSQKATPRCERERGTRAGGRPGRRTAAGQGGGRYLTRMHSGFINESASSMAGKWRQ